MKKDTIISFSMVFLILIFVGVVYFPTLNKTHQEETGVWIVEQPCDGISIITPDGKDAYCLWVGEEGVFKSFLLNKGCFVLIDNEYVKVNESRCKENARR